MAYSNLCVAVFIVYAAYSLSFVYCDDTISFSGPNLRFDNSVKSVRSTQVPDVILGILGFTVSTDDGWSGILSSNPFLVPKAAVIINILDGQDVPTNDIARTFSLVNDVDFETESDTLIKSLTDDCTDCSNNKLVAVLSPKEVILLNNETDSFSSSDVNDLLPQLRTSVDDTSINRTVPAVESFLKELNFILVISEKVKNIKLRDETKDLYLFQIHGLKALKDTDQMQPALTVLRSVLKIIHSNLNAAYGNDVLVLTQYVGDEILIRKSRSLLESSAKTTSTPPSDEKAYNLATQYSSEYQVTFAMVLFTFLIISLSLVAISVVMWNMDPGRDSIIYRMTSQRVKID